MEKEDLKITVEPCKKKKKNFFLHSPIFFFDLGKIVSLHTSILPVIFIFIIRVEIT